jgi:hypothetical protein
MASRGASSVWMEIELARRGEELIVHARGSGNRGAPPRSIGAAELAQLAAGVPRAARDGRPLGGLVTAAQALHRAVLGEAVAELRARLAEASAGEPLLLRLAASEPDLQAFPWEALCEPGTSMGFLASAPGILPVRSVVTNERWQPRLVRGAVQVLIIAPEGGASLARIQDALADRVASGEIELPPPITGAAASKNLLPARLRNEAPHVVHFLGHGRVGSRGVPELKLAGPDDDDSSWLSAELFAQELVAGFGAQLRLVVLEACEGAQPGAFGSAAEILAKAGADAALAHLWPVRFDVARRCSQRFYESLAGNGPGAGDVARSVNDARRAILMSFDESAEAFSPVLYLRAADGALFDFTRRKVVPAAAPPARATATGAPAEPPARPGADRPAAAPAVQKLVRAPFSLLLGDTFRELRKELSVFRDRLHKDLVKAAAPASPDLPMSALAQRHAMHRGAPKLHKEFQMAFQKPTELPLIDRLARALGPGVHTTLLRGPWLEHAVARQQPDRTLYVAQPLGDEITLSARQAGGEWEELEEPPAAFDPAEDMFFLRLYGGYSPQDILLPPLLTEDDYVQGLSALQGGLPADLANAVLAVLEHRPALILGVSLYTNHHRMLLQRLYARGVPRGSLAVIDPEDTERDLWEKGAGLPGKAEGVQVVASSGDDLAAALRDAEGP